MSTDLTTGTGPARVAFYNDPKIRSIIYQVVLCVIIALLVAGATMNVIEHLRRAHIASGFGFWDNTAGFDISQTLISYSAQASTYGRAFWVGLLNTLLVAGLGIVFATILGFTIGISRLSKNWLLSKFATGYVEIIRNLPLLLQLLFWYNAVLKALPELRDSIVIPGGAYLNNRGLFLPAPEFHSGFGAVTAAFLLGLVVSVAFAIWAHKRQERTGQQSPVLWVTLALVIGLPFIMLAIKGFPLSFEYPKAGRFNIAGGMEVVPEFAALLFGLSIYTAAFIAEVVRAGITAVSRGQTEAAYSLGLKPRPTLRLVVVPQAMRVIVPPLTSQYLNLTKNSTLAVAIGYPDLVQVFTGTVLNQTGQAIEVVAITMLVYLTISLTTSFAMNIYNKRVALVNGDAMTMSEGDLAVTELAFVRKAQIEQQPPPASMTGALGWLRENLLSTPFNIVLTVIVALLVLWIVPDLVKFLFIDAVWSGTDRDACREVVQHREIGACWPFVWERLPYFIYGSYPIPDRWRVDIFFLMLGVGVAWMLWINAPRRDLGALYFFIVLPICSYILLHGFEAIGLPVVDTVLWGGVLVTIVVASVGIVVSLPLGILLALGRRSPMPTVKLFSTIFIEFVRGVPLVTVLFMASVMLPLFVPEQFEPDKLLRALVGIALFASAYMAEVVRAGLQAIPKGQFEGAQAVGLRYWQMMGLIILPQALKITIPNIVNTYIGLFKDTTLVFIVGIFDLLRTIEVARIDPKWATPVTSTTGYAVAAIFYLVFCYGMSRYARAMEARLAKGDKR